MFKLKMHLKKIILLVFFIGIKISVACDCPAFPPLTKELFDAKNLKQIVFKGMVMRNGECNTIASCVFEIQELYFGRSTKHLTAVYQCSGDCVMNFNPGEEWIIYGEYIQLEKIKISFCSRSRKIEKSNSDEVDAVGYGCTTAQEVSFLRDNLGIKKVHAEEVSRE
ncbi:MAG: hypothetical protein IAF38_09170, partial [Bacteroidia bacterium]|nr:hypothetical protein [Bacteroidia bacterium]